MATAEVTRSSRQQTKFVAVLKDFYDGIWIHDVMTLAAALAFYTALSLAPLLLITLSVVSLLAQGSQNQLIEQIEYLIGPQAGQAIRVVIENADNRPQLGSWAGMIGVLILLFTASSVFAQLQASLNVIWGIAASNTMGVWNWLKSRLLSMGIVLAIGFVAAVSLVINAVLAFLFVGDDQVWLVINNLISLGVFTILFTLMFEFLPDKRIPLRSALIGGLLTAIFFSIGKHLIGLYLGRSAVGSAYGAAGSLIVLLVWVYYSSIILFMGAELTRAIANWTSGQVGSSPPKSPAKA